MASLLPDRKNTAPTAQTGGIRGTTRGDSPDWLARAQRAYESSTTYVDANYRKQWEDSIRAFNNQHPTDSKYCQPVYDKRSKLFRPKTRSIIRKNEAAAAAAFFSNMDVTSVLPSDPNNKTEVASAMIMKELLQYRLTKTIPWFQIVLGGLQDAQVNGVVCGHVYWKYEQRNPENLVTNALQTVKAEAPRIMEDAMMRQVSPEVMMGTTGMSREEMQSGPTQDEEYPEQSQLPPNAMQATPEGLSEQTAPQMEGEIIIEQQAPVLMKDEPAIDIIPVENIRFDPSASWIDPVNTSPYFIHMIPMYAMDVFEKMQNGEWKKMAMNEIAAATEVTPDSTRITRNRNKDDPYTGAARDVSDYEIVWVQRHIHKANGEDWEFYTLGDLALLTEPRLLRDSVFTGKRPYVIGNCNLETHKVMPSPVTQLAKGLQDETNEIANQRIDNVKFVLNKKWFVKRGKEADVNGLIRNVPGGVVMLDDPVDDVREISWPDVTGSSFQEHQVMSLEMDELLGSFNPAALMIAGANNSPAKNMQMVSNSSGTLTEYLIRTYVETFVQPVLRMLMLLEQKYETDQVVLAFAGKRAELFQRFGIDQVTDELLEKELTLTVNVGMGATDPNAKLNRFIAGITAYTAIISRPVPGLNVAEVGKEIFAHLGYADGARFTTVDNPQVLQLQQQLQQATAMIQQLQQKAKEKQTGHMVNLQKARENNQTKLQTVQIQEQNENRRAVATHMRALMEAQKMIGKTGQQ